jgi:hypothetical protein
MRNVILALAVLFVGSASVPAQAQAQVDATSAHYSPFVWRNSLIAARPDVKGFAENLAVDSKFPATTVFTTYPGPQVDVSFFSEVSRELERLNHDRSINHSGVDRSKYCSAHRSFAADTSLTSTCAAVNTAIADIKFHANDGCDFVRYPELAFKDYKQGPMDAKKMQTLEGLLEHTGETFYHFDSAQVWTNESFMNPLRVIVQKVKSPSLLAALDQRAKVYSNLKATLNAQPTCDPRGHIASVLKDVTAETTLTASDLRATVADGLRIAAADRDRVLKAGRFRDVLPYPSLTDDERQLLSMVMGAVYWRMRGGALVYGPKGTNDTRIYYNKYPMGVIGALNGNSVGHDAGERQYWELVLHGWGKWMDMGHTPGDGDLWYDFVRMTDRGAVQVESASQILTDASYDPFEFKAGGRQMGLCYYYVWQNFGGFKVSGDVLPLPYRWFLEGETSWGELCTGGAISLGLSKSLLKGRTQPN